MAINVPEKREYLNYLIFFLILLIYIYTFKSKLDRSRIPNYGILGKYFTCPSEDMRRRMGVLFLF